MDKSRSERTMADLPRAPRFSNRRHMEQFANRLRAAMLEQSEVSTKTFRRPVRFYVRYAMLTILIGFSVASANESFRQAVSEGLARILKSVDSAGRALLTGDSKSYNSITDKANTVTPTTLDNAKVDQLLGITMDKSALCFLAVDSRAEDWMGKTSSSSLWSVDLKTGKLSIIHSGGVLDVSLVIQAGAPQMARMGLRGIAYYVRPRHAPMDVTGGLPQFKDQLWFWQPGREPIMVDGGPVADWPVVFSPDGGQMLYYRLGEQAQVLDYIYDLNKSRSAPAPIMQRALAWTSNGFIVPLETQDGNKEGKATIAAVNLISSSGKPIASAEGYEHRGGTGRDSEFNGHNNFFIPSRDHKYFDENREDQIGIYSVNPFKRVLNTPGYDAVWDSNGQFAMIKRCGENDHTTSSTIGMFNAQTAQLRDIDLTQLDPPYNAPWFGAAPTNLGEVFSPAPARLVLNGGQSREDARSGLLDVHSGKVLYAWEGLRISFGIWSPGGRYIVARDQNGSSSLVDTQSGEISRIKVGGSPVCWLDEDRTIWLAKGERESLPDLAIYSVSDQKVERIVIH